MSSHAVQLTLVALIAVTLLVPILRTVFRKSFDPFEPIVIFAVSYGVMFVVRPLAMIIRHDFSYHAPLSVINVESQFTKMLILALIGAVSFVAGYSLSVRKHLTEGLSSDCRRFDPRIASLTAGIVAGAAVLSLFILVLHSGPSQSAHLLLRGRTPEFTKAIDSLSLYPWTATLMLIPAALTFLALAWQGRSKLFLLVFFLLTGLIALRAVPAGDRLVLLAFLGGIFVLSYLRRSTRPGVLALLGLACTALVLSTFLSDLRGRSTRKQTVAETFSAITSHPSRIVDPLFRGPDSEMAPVLAAALQVIPSQLPYGYGSVIFGDLARRPVPRTLWSYKPQPPRERLVSTLWPAENARGSVAPEFSVLLYFYWDFGSIGVALGLGIFGFGARFLYDYLLSRRGDLPAELLYSVALWFIVIGLRNGPVDTLITAVVLIGPLLAITTLASTKKATMGVSGGAQYRVDYREA
jgi:hypothetical protein